MRLLACSSLLLGCGELSGGQRAIALPPPDDIPEEVLRTDIVLHGQSPIHGEFLDAAQLAALEAQLREELRTTPIAPERAREAVFQLSILRAIRVFLPFVPIP
ncbi:MAG TPA: hypothetical protein IGS37_19800 [Synechococcales cyanobacterium M55_K2018_004]|nr:hypothetical protein [Synechococcales cyanobacterium M55_K2018_004]